MKKLGYTLATVAAFGLAACEDGPTNGNEPGTVSMLITDAPGDFRTAIVTIDRIELLRGGTDDEDSDSTDDDRVVLRDIPWTGDLLELSNDVDEIVSEIDVPAGSYSQLRVVISGGCIEVEGADSTSTTVYASSGYSECGEADGNLQMPSFASSGLKINLPSGFDIDGDHRILLIDFDVSESFGHAAGNSGNWVMDPVIHATEVVMSGALDVSLVVADSVTLPRTLTADSFMIQLDDEPAITVVNGVASFDFLMPGTYSVDLVSPDSVTVTTDPVLPLSVEVGSSSEASATITITRAD